MKSPYPNEWEELPDGSLRYKSTATHTICEVLIIPVEERKPLLTSRVFLVWRNRDTGVTAYWANKKKQYMVAHELALSTAIDHARLRHRDTGMLLRIGITDEHEHSIFSARW